MYYDRRGIDQPVDVEGRDGLMARDLIAGGEYVGYLVVADAVLLAGIAL